jgi:diguanylate cyclase (GGDEF)-like protein
MVADLERPRMLLLGAERERAELRALFAGAALACWEVVQAESIERARFVLQAQAIDVLLLDGSLYRPAADGLAWLAEQTDAPVLLLGDGPSEAIAEALRRGAHAWLPRERALACPALLDVALRKAVQMGLLRRRAAALDDELSATRERVDRLVSLLWEAAPGQWTGRWFTQRHMLQRLDEEVARAQRHGGPLTVVLGELRSAEGGSLPAGDSRRLASWTADRVAHNVRRCDVAGQYGLHAFMLLLPRAGSAEAAGACRRLRAVLEPPAGSGPFPPLHACFGVAGLTPQIATVQGLLRRAEERLERAKAEPGGGAVLE